MKKIHLICAARPNFMKITPLYHVLKNEGWCQTTIIHTGQHYSHAMSQAFFDEFNLPTPQYNLKVGSGTHAEQTANTMIAYEKLCNALSMPDLVIVVGDVNATLACAITAKKLNVTVAHLEAGLRSFDRTMPEEINRVVTDSITDIFWTPSSDANTNLMNEGVDSESISFVGNIMIDTLCMMKQKISNSPINKELNLTSNDYIVLTLHRPSNVDKPEVLERIMIQLKEIDNQIIFPVHPRTRKTLDKLSSIPKNIKLIDPLNYIEFMALVDNSKFLITDSGGIQEETTYLNIPCFTLRRNTERPITISQGTNQLVSIDNLLNTIKNPKTGHVPELWDGKTASRIKEDIKRRFNIC